MTKNYSNEWSWVCHYKGSNDDFNCNNCNTGLENNYIFFLDNGSEAVQRRSASVRHAGAVPLAWGLRTHRHLQGV
jgi:hypothetical protein